MDVAPPPPPPPPPPPLPPRPTTAAGDSHRSTSAFLEEKILWSCIARNDVILAEVGEDPFDGAVAETAQLILSKKSTPGWEFCTYKKPPPPANSSNHNKRNKNNAAAAAAATVVEQQQDDDILLPSPTVQRHIPRLKGIKFHVYEQDSDEILEYYYNAKSSSYCGSGCAQYVSPQGGPVVWVFAAVYNPEAWENYNDIIVDVKNFIQKMEGLTALPRLCDPAWRKGPQLACQVSFAAILLQRMQEVTYYGKWARMQQSLYENTHLMQDNITAILEYEDRFCDFVVEQQKQRKQQVSTNKKNNNKKKKKKNRGGGASDNDDEDDDDDDDEDIIPPHIQRKMNQEQRKLLRLQKRQARRQSSTLGPSRAIRRQALMQSARYGAVVGSLVTAVVAVAIAAPLIAFL
ncbi:hypothetical protein ACA910_012309 [Epithemia clementina (nom. ined.)]